MAQKKLNIGWETSAEEQVGGSHIAKLSSPSSEPGRDIMMSYDVVWHHDFSFPGDAASGCASVEHPGVLLGSICRFVMASLLTGLRRTFKVTVPL